MARNHQIELVCFGSPDADFAAIKALEALGIVVRVVHWNMLLAMLSAFRAAFNPRTPFQVALFQSCAFHSAVHSALIDFKVDAVYAVNFRGLGNLGSYRGPLFVDLVDSVALNFFRRLKKARGLERWFLGIEYRRVAKYEKKVAQTADRSFVVSSIDKKFIGGDKVDVIPLGIDVKYFHKSSVVQEDPVIVFTGNMNYKPNEDAVLWFYRYCWGLLKTSLPQIRFIVAGSSPTAAVVALGSDPAITITGRVPSLATVINSSQISIAPMQSGSGMQFKILEAMACGVPVVATTLGVGDIQAEVGKDLLVADEPDLFVNAVLLLLNSKELRTKIGDAGKHYVSEHHTWDSLNELFESATLGKL